MEVTREDADGVTIVKVSGEVDMRSSVELRKELAAVTGTSAQTVAISLAGVTYIDSSGIATLIDCLKKVSACGGTLALIGVNDNIYPVFELAQLVNVFDIRRENTV